MQIREKKNRKNEKQTFLIYYQENLIIIYNNLNSNSFIS